MNTLCVCLEDSTKDARHSTELGAPNEESWAQYKGYLRYGGGRSSDDWLVGMGESSRIGLHMQMEINGFPVIDNDRACRQHH